MSALPAPEPVENRRFSDATATQVMNLDRPLGFMSPAERVRLYEQCVAPMKAVLVRLYTDHAKFNLRSQELEGDQAALEKQLLDSIALARAQILGGLTEAD